MSSAPPPPARPKRRLAVKIAVCLVIIAIAPFAILILLRVPNPFHPRYLSRVTMEVKTAKNDEVFASSRPAMNEQEFQQTIEGFRAPAVLDQLVEQLHLTREFAKDGKPLSPAEARERLRRDLRFEQVRGTGLIEVGAYASSPQLAAEIANTLSVVYRNKRIAEKQEALNLALTPYQAEVDKQRKVVESAHQAASDLRKKLGLPEQSSEENNPAAAQPEKPASRTPEPPEYVEAKARSVLAKDVLEAAERRLSVARMESMVDFEPVRIWEKAVPPLGAEAWWR